MVSTLLVPSPGKEGGLEATLL
nr:unnamed protein product [Callosobruchus chinensis]